MGMFCFSGPGAETQLTFTGYLWFDENSVSVANRPEEALLLRLFDGDQNLIVPRA